jgi:hypothetical protein
MAMNKAVQILALGNHNNGNGLPRCRYRPSPHRVWQPVKTTLSICYIPCKGVRKSLNLVLFMGADRSPPSGCASVGRPGGPLRPVCM